MVSFYSFYSILFYSLSLSVSLRRAPRFSLLAVDTPALACSRNVRVLSQKKVIFFSENFTPNSRNLGIKVKVFNFRGLRFQNF